MTNQDPRERLSGTIDGAKSWGGNPTTSYLSGDNRTVFWGRNDVILEGDKRVMYYSVYSVDETGHRELVWRSGPGVGQALLAVDWGYLVLTYRERTGDGSADRRVVIPKFVRRKYVDG